MPATATSALEKQMKRVVRPQSSTTHSQRGIAAAATANANQFNKRQQSLDHMNLKARDAAITTHF